MELAISALLRHATIAQAAGACGISERTLIRWLQQPDFAREYRAARRMALEKAIEAIQALTSTAVVTLNDVMRNPASSDGARVAASRTVLEFALRSMELEDLEARVLTLEQSRAAQR